MEHQSSFLTGFLTGQRLKRWQRGLASGDVPGGGTNFYQWAGQAGAPPELTDPDAYEDYVGSMPLKKVTDGGFLWQPSINDFYSLNFEPGGGPVPVRSNGAPVRSPGDVLSHNGGNYRIKEVVLDARSILIEFDYIYSGGYSDPVRIFSYIDVPVTGVYRAASFQTAFSGSFMRLNHEIFSFSVPYRNQESNQREGSRLYLAQENSVLSQCSHLDMTCFLPTFIIRPMNPEDVPQSVRPGTLAGSPINEQAKTFTNPITGEIISFDSFSYDYQTRTYTLTLPGGNKMDVTFGDNTIKITDLGSGEGTQEEPVEAMYPDNAGSPVVSPDGEFHKDAFLSGLAAGMACHGC